MEFFNYLWGLLNRPLKKGKENKRWLTALGAELDDLKQSIFQLRKAWLVKTAPKEGLELLGEARGLPRYKDEDLELYRERVLAAFETYQNGGTYPAVKKTLSVLGYPNSEIQLLYNIDPDRWAEFNIFLNQEKINEAKNLDVVKKEIRRVKQASSLPNYIATYYQKFLLKPKDIIANSNLRPACGTISCYQDNFNRFYRYGGHLEKNIFSLLAQDITANFTPRVCRNDLKNANNGLKIKTRLVIDEFIKVKDNKLKVCSLLTKTASQGSIEVNSVEIKPQITSRNNSIPVCSSTTKYISGRLVS